MVEGGGCSRLRAHAFLAKIDTSARRWLQIQYAKRRRTSTGDESWLRATGGVDQRLAVRSSSGCGWWWLCGYDDGKPFTILQHVSGRERGRRTRFGGSWGVTKTMQDIIERTQDSSGDNGGEAGFDGRLEAGARCQDGIARPQSRHARSGWGLRSTALPLLRACNGRG